jgi:hypothetical protein
MTDLESRVRELETKSLRADHIGRMLDTMTEALGPVIQQHVDGLVEPLRAEVKKLRSDNLALHDRLASVEEKGTLEYLGVWKPDTSYQRGNFVTWQGSMWHASRDTQAKPGESSPEASGWTLSVKRGSDGQPAKGVATPRSVA